MQISKTSLNINKITNLVLVLILLLTFIINTSLTSSATPYTITEFEIPTENSGPAAITSGPDGNLWFTQQFSNKIGRITPSGVITEFEVPTEGGGPLGIANGPDGNLWFTQMLGDKIGRITPSGVITEFDNLNENSYPMLITAGPDGNIWFTQSNSNKIGRITPSGVITEFEVPTEGSAPVGITTGPDGNLWFTQLNGNKIGRITPSGVITEFEVPTEGSWPTGITNGPDGNLWFTQQISNKIGRITPSGVITEFEVPTISSDPANITSGPDGNLWFTQYYGNKIGRLELPQSGGNDGGGNQNPVTIPNNGDANNDGIPDSEQPHVDSAVSPVTGRHVTMQAPEGSVISNFVINKEGDNSTNNDMAYEYPFGIVSFTIEGIDIGSSQNITILHHDVDSSLDSLVVRKHNPNTNSIFTLGSSNSLNLSLVTIDNKSVVRLSFDVVDGGDLDIDNEANGVIVDPIGIAVQTVGSPQTGIGKRVNILDYLVR